MFPDRMHYTIQGGTDIAFPRLLRLRQNYDPSRVEDIPAAVREAVAAVPLPDLRGKRIAVTGGSRGVANIDTVTRCVVDILKERGAEPFIFPAMGSHGGGKAEGQTEYLAGYNITEASMGCPVVSSMETVEIGALACGVPVYCDRSAWEADGIVVINRVKPHPNFKGEIESGLCKMIAIGMGKHKGAASLHQRGFDTFAEVLPEAAGVHLRAGKILFALGLVENAYDETACIEALPPAAIIEGEKRLLAEAKRRIAKFLLPKIDVLIVEEIGKNISGSGMDPNVTGRPLSGLPGFATVPIRKIVVLDLTPETMGNATGLGPADVTTLGLIKKINFDYVYTNAMTSTELMAGKLPVFVNNDREAIAVGIICCPRVTPETALVAKIKNTLCLGEIEVSESYLPLVTGREEFTVVSDPRPMRFDAAGRLLRDQL
ncbi:MAG: lactate racemase domain-containing protein [Planctomycetes bacterium]|nr:lactate racemase domain-containing protein [Planctomycetota bacterium]